MAGAMMLAMGLSGCGGAASSAVPVVPVPGTLGVASASATVMQAAGSVTVSVVRTGGSNGAVSVSFATSDGTAVGGTDYTKATGTLSWADGDTAAKSLTVPVTSAPAFYGSKTFSVTISSATGGASVGTATETVTISGGLAVPVPGTLAVSASAATVMQASGSATVTVNRTVGVNGAVSVSYTTADGTAVAGTDYTKTTGTLSWADGDASAKTVSVAVSTAPGFGATKAFSFVLSSPTGGASLGTSTEAITIAGSLSSPSNYFDLSGVKLQLPIDIYGGTGGVNNIQYAEAEVTSAQLVAGYASPYFYGDASNRMVFMAPSNGAVSTPGSGSDHTRSELRELYAGAGADSNNDWNSAIGGTLTATMTVQATSADSDEATIAQIHNQSYVFVLLLYRPANRDIAFDLYSSLGSSTHVRTSMVQNVNLGDVLSYSINYKGNNIAVTVTTASQTKTQNFAVDPSWAGTPVYFKLGAYSAAPNIGNPAGDKTQTAFTSFAITH